MATDTGTPPPSRDHDSSTLLAQELDDSEVSAVLRAHITPLSPSKRQTDESEPSTAPGKRTRLGSTPVENGVVKDHNLAVQPLNAIRPSHDSLLNQLSDQVLEQFSDTTGDEICAAIPQPPSYMQRRTSIHLSLEDNDKESIHWARLTSSADDITPVRLKHILSRRQIELASVALTLLQPDFQNLEHLHRHFLQIFGSFNGSQLAWQLDSLHDLKVQLCFTKLQNQSEREREEIVDAFFPQNIEQQLRDIYGKPRSPSVVETEFLNRCQRTRDNFISYQTSKVPRFKGQWQHFLQNIANHLHVEITCLRGQNETQLNKEALEKAVKDHDQIFIKATSIMDTADETTEDDLLTQAALAAHAQERAHQASGLRASTSEQLAQGRIAASSKPSHRPRDPKANQSHRRPWSCEEEDALLKGLDIVKGPFWSQILALFGEKGSISNILRDRNQVQLKDKARNLKLFFLKNDQPVPKSLEKVTGDLKTRAPMYLLSPDEDQDDTQPELSSVAERPQVIANGSPSRDGVTNDRDQEKEGSNPISESSAPVSPPQAEPISANGIREASNEDFDEAMEAAIRQAVASVQAEQDRAQV